MSALYAGGGAAGNSDYLGYSCLQAATSRRVESLVTVYYYYLPSFFSKLRKIGSHELKEKREHLARPYVWAYHQDLNYCDV